MGEESSEGSWWGGWLQAAKDKSSEAITFIRRDLEEFSSVVQTDTRSLVASTATTIRDRIALPESQHASEGPVRAEAESPSVDANPIPVDAAPRSLTAAIADADAVSDAADADAESASAGSALSMLGISADEVKEVKEFASKTGQFVSQGFSSFLTSVSQALIIPPDDDDEDPIVCRENGMIYGGSEARLHCLRVDPLTYAEEPSGPSYERWLDRNDLERQKAEIANLLVDSTEVRAHYTQMVPSVVSHAQFWSRYFFKVEQMEAEERRRAALKKRADDAAAGKNDAADLGWGDEEDEEEEEEKGDEQKEEKVGIEHRKATQAEHLSPFTPPSASPSSPSSSPLSPSDGPSSSATAATITTASTTTPATAAAAPSAASSTVPSALLLPDVPRLADAAETPFTSSSSSFAALPLLKADVFDVGGGIGDISGIAGGIDGIEGIGGELSAAEVDCLLSMEDELRSGSGSFGTGSGSCGIDGGSGVGFEASLPTKIDPRLVDELLEREASLSPLKSRSRPSTAEKQNMSTGSLRESTPPLRESTPPLRESTPPMKEPKPLMKQPTPPTKMNIENEDEDELRKGGKVDELLQTESFFEKTAGEAGEAEAEAEAEKAQSAEESSEVLSVKTKDVDYDDVVDDDEVKDGGDTLKGLVVVDGVDDDSAIASRTTPTPTPTPTPSKESGAASAASSAAASAAASAASSAASSGDDWERELELDLTEEERTMADKLLKDDGKLDDDWENWE